MHQKKGVGSNKPTSLQRLEEGEKLQQRASMKKGEDAINLYKTAVDKYKESIQLKLPADQTFDAYTFVGECYHGWAETILKICQSLSSRELTLQKQREAKLQSCQLFEQAVEWYQKGGEREDALIGCGNAFASWGENTQDFQQADFLYSEALNMYRKIPGMEQDVDSLSNYADVCMQKGQNLCENGKINDGLKFYKEGAEVYMRACSQCDSIKGDDLPGLLSNWGNALVDMADNIQDNQQAIGIYDEAIERLQACLQFARGDVDPFISLGNALVAKAKKLSDTNLYKQAIQNGFEGALKINNSNSEAMVGIAEALFDLAKATTDEQAKQTYLQQSIERYKLVLGQLDKIEGFEQRCDIQYNYACVLTAASKIQEAVEIISWLLKNEGVTIQEIAGDQDLLPLQQVENFKGVFQQ